MDFFIKKANKTLIPYKTSVATIGETTYPTLQAAFDAVKNNETITLVSAH